MSARMMVWAGLLTVVGFALMPGAASAGHGDISLPVGTVVKADEGDIVTLVSEPVDPALQGATCTWGFHVRNQKSVHPGNDLILSTNGFAWEVTGVEDAADQALDIDGSFELGETVTVSLRMGSDGIFSAGLSIEVVCGEGAAGATAVPTATVVPVPTAEATGTPTVTPEVKGTAVTAQPTASAGAALANTGPPSIMGPLVILAGLFALAGVGAVALGSRPRH